VITRRPPDRCCEIASYSACGCVCRFEAHVVVVSCRRRHSAVTQTTPTIQFQTHFGAADDDSVISLSLEIIRRNVITTGQTTPHHTHTNTVLHLIVTHLHACLFVVSIRHDGQTFNARSKKLIGSQSRPFYRIWIQQQVDRYAFYERQVS